MPNNSLKNFTKTKYYPTLIFKRLTADVNCGWWRLNRLCIQRNSKVLSVKALPLQGHKRLLVQKTLSQLKHHLTLTPTAKPQPDG